MNDKFSEQKDTLVSIKKEISLLHQQVDYLIRNEKPLELLDLDVMMNRTHTIYDLMCGVEVGSEELGVRSEELGVRSEELGVRSEEDEELPIDPNAIRAIFGVDQEEPEPIQEEPEPIQEEPEPIQEEPEPIQEEPEPIQEEPEPIQEEPEPIQEEPIQPIKPIEPIQPIKTTPTEIPENPLKEEPIQPIKPIEPIQPIETTPTEDLGFILNFEPAEEKPIYTTGDEIEMNIPHTEEAPIEEEAPAEEEIPYEPVIFGNMEEKEDSGFELDTPETLGDRLQQEEDHSLAAKLQHSTVNDLRTAIGINDKFLLVNELFGGSMEKYNRSMDNLNDLKTLNGALIYMNELRIELQWNSNNEAYKKLLELVHRKFEA